ncbi:unnamed protein product [Rhizophagus irregularis]|nr:unnamed protein product [Rhizophagus irregularis]
MTVTAFGLVTVTAVAFGVAATVTAFGFAFGVAATVTAFGFAFGAAVTAFEFEFGVTAAATVFEFGLELLELRLGKTKSSRVGPKPSQNTGLSLGRGVYLSLEYNVTSTLYSTQHLHHTLLLFVSLVVFGFGVAAAVTAFKFGVARFIFGFGVATSPPAIMAVPQSEF